MVTVMPASSATSRTAASVADSPGSTVPPGSPQFSVSRAPHQQDASVWVADGGERGGPQRVRPGVRRGRGRTQPGEPRGPAWRRWCRGTVNAGWPGWEFRRTSRIGRVVSLDHRPQRRGRRTAERSIRSNGMVGTLILLLPPGSMIGSWRRWPRGRGVAWPTQITPGWSA